MAKLKVASLKKKVEPSRRVLARAFARQKVEAPPNVLARVFSGSGLEKISREGVDAWFKKIIFDQFKKWHVHKDGSSPQLTIVGSEDFSTSQSELEKSMASIKASETVSPGSYDVKKAGQQQAATTISYTSDGGKGEIKYTTTNVGSAYKSGGDVAGAYKHSAVQYSSNPNATVQCSCGLVAHANMDNKGNVGFVPLGNQKSDSGMYSAYKGGGDSVQPSEMYRAQSSNVSYTNT